MQGNEKNNDEMEKNSTCSMLYIACHSYFPQCKLNFKQNI